MGTPWNPSFPFHKIFPSPLKRRSPSIELICSESNPPRGECWLLFLQHTGNPKASCLPQICQNHQLDRYFCSSKQYSRPSTLCCICQYPAITVWSGVKHWQPVPIATTSLGSSARANTDSRCCWNLSVWRLLIVWPDIAVSQLILTSFLISWMITDGQSRDVTSSIRCKSHSESKISLATEVPFVLAFIWSYVTDVSIFLIISWCDVTIKETCDSKS